MTKRTYKKRTIEEVEKPEIFHSPMVSFRDEKVESVQKEREEKKVEEEVVEKAEKVEIREKEGKKIEKPKTKIIKKFFAVYKGPRGSITLSPHIGKVMRGVSFEITERDASTLVGSNFVVEVRYEHIKI